MKPNLVRRREQYAAQKDPNQVPKKRGRKKRRSPTPEYEEDGNSTAPTNPAVPLANPAVPSTKQGKEISKPQPAKESAEDESDTSEEENG